MHTYLAVVSIRLNKDPFETRLDVMDVVIVLQLQREEGGENRQGPVMKLRQLTEGPGWGHLGTCAHYLGVPYAFGSFSE